MRKRISMLICICLFFMAHVSWAQDCKARVDINATKEKITLIPGQKPSGGMLMNASWRKEKGEDVYYLFSQSPQLKSEQWTDYQFSFTPDKDGQVTIILKGPYIKQKDVAEPEEVWVCFDDIEIAGVDIINGDFNEDHNGNPKGWSLKDASQYIDDNGNKYVKVWHNAPCRQIINVKAGQEVTVKAKIKKME